MARPVPFDEYKAGWAAAIQHAKLFAQPTIRDYGDYGATAPDINWDQVSLKPVVMCAECGGSGRLLTRHLAACVTCKGAGHV